MNDHWERIERRLAALGCLDAAALRPGASDAVLEELERALGVTLPGDVKRFLAIHDGQDGIGLVYGDRLLSCAAILAEWQVWRSLDEDEMNADCADSMTSVPEGVIKPMYCNPAWIPLTQDGGGNHVGLDFDPDTLGSPGQVIAFGRDQDAKRLLAPDFGAFVAQWAAWLERVEWNGRYLDGPLP